MENTPNKNLVDNLKLISTFYKYKNDSPRSNAYSNAAIQIASIPTVITSGEEAKELVQFGIGPSITHDINEFLRTGKITRLENLKNEDVSRSGVVELFTKIHGISSDLANYFYDLGYRTYDDLWLNAKLTEAQKLGLLYLEHFAERIDRIEMDIIKSVIEKKFDGIEFELVGSYRRQTETSGDIDVLIKKMDGVNIRMIIDKLREYLIGDLAIGESKYLGIWQMPGFNAHRIDILLSNPENWAASLLYFTGSKTFNILIRKKAKELNLRLNEYGLFNDKGERYELNSEKDIFDLLGLKYLEPKERTDYLNYLEYKI
jgi:DNA polymerase/3'-5' exonuclease PolX